MKHVAPALAAFALLVMGPVRPSFEVTHLPKELVIAVLAAVLVRRFTAARRFDALDASLIAFGAVTALSAALALSPALAWRPALLTLATLTIALTVRDVEDRALWLEWLGAAVVVLAVLGLVEGVGLVRWSLAGRAPSSLLGQRNTLAHVLVLGLVVLCELAERRKAWWLGVALVAAVVVMTRSRAAWLAAPVMTLVMSLASRRPWPVLVVAAGAGVALLLPALPWRAESPYADSFHRLFDAAHGSGAGRLEQWSGALAAVPAHPVLGVGPGNGQLTLPRETNRFLNSDAVALLVERGALGALLGLAVAALLFRRRAAALAAVAVTGAFDAVTQLPAGALLFTCVAFVGLKRATGPRSESGSWPLAAFFGLGALACALAFASRLYSTSDDVSFQRLERAVRLDPTDAFTRLELVRAQVSAGRCDDARPHLPALERQLPGQRRARDVLQAFENFCGP